MAASFRCLEGRRHLHHRLIGARMDNMSGSRRAAGVLAILLAAGGAVAYGVADNGVIGPNKHETGNGRVLHPAGRMTKVGNFPTGGALTRNGRFYWSVSTGRGLNDIRIVNLHKHRVIQTVPIPGASGGIVMDPTRNRAYVSGVADSAHLDEDRPG